MKAKFFQENFVNIFTAKQPKRRPMERFVSFLAELRLTSGNSMRIHLSLISILLLFMATVAMAAPDSIVIPSLQAKAQVLRDIDGIPHVLAENEHDLCLMQGWTHARDRLFQMDLARRLASGTLAELFGEAALASDVEFRTIGLRRSVEKSFQLLSAETQAAAQAYAEGVNAYVAMHPLPLEYKLIEISLFEPWTPIDSLVVGKLMNFSLSFDIDTWLTDVLLTYQTTGIEQGFDGISLFFEDLFRSAPFDPASTVPDSTSAAPKVPSSIFTGIDSKYNMIRQGLSSIRPETLTLARDYANRLRGLSLFEKIIDMEQFKGSNEWAVSGNLTNTGRPLVANDPHLSLDVPSTLYQMHLLAVPAGFDIFGSSIPGVPFIIMGQNTNIAWGITVNPMDVTDTFQEEVVPDPDSPSGLSTVHIGKNEPIIPLPQVFRYNQIGDGILDNLVEAPPNSTVGGTFIPAAILIVPRRNQGPIVALDLDAGVALSIQYTGFSGTPEADAIRLLNLAQNMDDFIAALQFVDTGSLNWAYADLEGNIAYLTSGEVPIREDIQAGLVNGLPPFFIRQGTGGNEWLPVANPQPGQAIPYEILPFDEMPHVINPPGGYFVNANNDPLGITLDNDPLNQLRPGGGIYYLNASYAIGTRASRITQRLEEHLASGSVSAEDMKAIQADIVMLDAQVFTPFILQAFDNAKLPEAQPELAQLAEDARVIEAIGRLAAWDHSTPTGIPEGYDANDFNGHLIPPGQEEITASVAATIYSVWRGQMIHNTIDRTLGAFDLPGPNSSLTMKALRNLLDNFNTNQGIGASGLNFFEVPEVNDPPTRRDIIILQSLIDALDLLASEAFEETFGGSTNQEDYRWGRLHRIVLDHPFGAPFSIPPAGRAFPPSLDDLPGIPVDGGFGVVDASIHSVRADSSHEFMFGGGPNRRYVGQPHPMLPRFQGWTSLPGGASGVLFSPYYANLLGQWLTNDTYPMRFLLKSISRDLAQRESFVPGK